MSRDAASNGGVTKGAKLRSRVYKSFTAQPGREQILFALQHSDIVAETALQGKMQTKTRIVLLRYTSLSREQNPVAVFFVKEVIGSMTPTVGSVLDEKEVQELLNDKRNQVVIRAKE